MYTDDLVIVLIFACICILHPSKYFLAKVFQLQIQILSFLNISNTNTNTFYKYLNTTVYKY